MLPKWFNILKLVIAFVLCLVYSSWIGIGLIFTYLFKKDPNFWTPKERSKPAKLQSEEYGKHKFAHVNVIQLLLSLSLSLAHAH